MAQYQMQALSSADGELYSWVASSADYAGTGYRGPGSPLDIAVASGVSGGAAGAAGAAGAGLVPPVDFVLTSNDSLSGTAARDGVTLVAGVTRGLATAQTTASQNGIWLAGAGGWTRPADFSSDAQVIPGQNIFIKSGTNGANSNWQLTSGTTIAGAKSYKKLATGGSRAAVSLVQTAALPAYTYDGTAQTLTANANGALATTIFDGVIPLVADTIHDVLVVLEGVRNGIYTKTQDGSVSTPWIFTRRIDLRASADFVGGVAVDVINGATALRNNKGTRWALTTATAVVLDTTATTWAATGRAEFDYVKLSDPPYLIGKNPLIDDGINLRKFAYDAKQAVAAGAAPQIGVLPCGSVYVDSPVRFASQTGVIGPGRDRCVITNKYHCGGFTFIFGNYVLPTPYGGTVDTRAGAQPITLYDETAYTTPPGPSHPWLNLTTDLLFFWNESATSSNLPETGWPAFEWLENFHVASLTLGSGQGYIASCQGRRTEPDPLDTLFAIWLTPDGGVHARLRLTDVTTGAYGAITRTGTGTSVMTGDATIKPNQDITSLKIKFLTGTTAIGVAGATYQWSIDGGLSWDTYVESPNVLGTASSITFGLPTDRFVAKFNFAAGSIVAGDVYSLSTSGVDTTYALNLAAGTVTVGGVYELCLQYDSGTGNGGLYCSPTGGARVGSTFSGGHGVVLQKPWETTIMGADMNWQCGEDLNPAFDPAKIHVGTFRISDGGITVPPTTTRTTIPPNIGTGQRAFLCFGWDPIYNQDNRTYEGDGTSAIGWLAMGSTSWLTPGPTGGIRVVIPRRQNLVSYPTQMVCSGFTVSNKGSFGQRAGVFALQSTRGCRYSDLYGDFGNGGDFFRNQGPSFFAKYENICCTNGRKQLTSVGGLVTMLGHWVLDGGMVNVVACASSIQQTGELFINLEEFNRGCLWLGGSYDGDSRLTNVIVDDENNFAAVKHDTIIRASAHGQNRLTLGGQIGGNGQRMNSIIWTGGPSDGKLDLVTLPVQFVTGRSCAIVFTNAAAPSVPLNAHSSVAGATAFCNRPGKVWAPSRGRPPNAPNITSATTTLSFAAGQRNLMPAGTTTGPQSIALPVAGMNEGDTFEVAIEAQAHAVTLTSPGMTSHVVTAGLDVVRTFQLQDRQNGGTLVRV